ncbi:hypothetical protein BN77_p2210001 [Rhizobium mesoamericanum STM3625]|uniref:Uncharacterized protein n=1 Tax=Rhizobium mesoamericanum STM3625 TaxID=1211777 RepID=K0Q6Q2_9HYPH|nr:hypothetical protein BN77_p2210001 [Rhizobium mesoamericanum STM3625]
MTISPRSGRLGRVERAERGRVITFPFGFSFLTGNCSFTARYSLALAWRSWGSKPHDASGNQPAR